MEQEEDSIFRVGGSGGENGSCLNLNKSVAVDLLVAPTIRYIT